VCLLGLRALSVQAFLDVSAARTKCQHPGRPAGQCASGGLKGMLAVLGWGPCFMVASTTTSYTPDCTGKPNPLRCAAQCVQACLMRVRLDQPDPPAAPQQPLCDWLAGGAAEWLLWPGPRHAQYEHPAETRTLVVRSSCILCMHSVPSAMAELTP
jgi:hypothetical protein